MTENNNIWIRLIEITAKSKAKTPEGAQKLFDNYKEKHPDTEKQPRDFLEEGAEKEDKKSLKERLKGAVKTIGLLATDKEARKKMVKGWKEKAKDFGGKFKQEMKESKEMLGTVKDMISGKKVSPEAKTKAKEQVVDLMRMSVMGAASVSPIPGTLPIIMMATKAINNAFDKNFSWAPSAWEEKSAADISGLGPDEIADLLVGYISEQIENPSEELIKGAQALVEAEIKKEASMDLELIYRDPEDTPDQKFEFTWA